MAAGRSSLHRSPKLPTLRSEGRPTPPIVHHFSVTGVLREDVTVALQRHTQEHGGLTHPA